MNNKNVDVSAILPILQKIPLFKGLNEGQHKEIISHIVLMYYPEGFQLFTEGDQGDALYIVKRGSVDIYKEPVEEGDHPNKITEILANGFFGEMALISEQPRNASAKTLEESELFILSKDDFKKLLESNTELAEQISTTMIDRMNENDKNAL